MTLYLIPDHAQPVTLDTLRHAFPGVAWANEDAGGPDADALALVGGAIAPPQPDHEAASEFVVWNDDGWTVAPLLLDAGGGNIVGSSGGGYV